MLLTKKQKKFLFTEVMSKEDQVKIFETCDLEWLLNQKFRLENDLYGWKGIWLGKEKQTILNFPNNPGWQEVLDHIDEYEQCEWCELWFHKEDELVHYHKWRLCDRCKSYLQSRGE